MLNYDLVTPKAAYRILKKRDLGRLLELVFAFYSEIGKKESISREKVERTVESLLGDSGMGTVFMVEKEQDLIGYAIVVNRWSNEHGGNILRVDEIYIAPPWRRNGIAGDFINLLCKVAPQGSVAVEVEVEGAARKAAALWRRLDFKDNGARVMIRTLA